MGISGTSEIQNASGFDDPEAFALLHAAGTLDRTIDRLSYGMHRRRVIMHVD